MPKGLIHVYTGEGKGKTTAAFGLAKRAAGHGKRVMILQFLKSRVSSSGEAVMAERSGIRVIRFTDQTTPLFDPDVKLSKLKAAVRRAIAFTIKQMQSGAYDVVVLDEFVTVLGCGYATIRSAMKVIDAKPDDVELVMTGRGAPEELVEAADYVTEMRMIKHPFTRGVRARKGIEF